jgi:predicted RNA-binding Zn-ribbon protein involved in translation (DUF1610 family)
MATVQKESFIVAPAKGKRLPDFRTRRSIMRINCISCGHKVELDDAYDDFEGPVKCLCGAMLMIRTEEGRLKGINLAEPLSRQVVTKANPMGGGFA